MFHASFGLRLRGVWYTTWGKSPTLGWTWITNNVHDRIRSSQTFLSKLNHISNLAFWGSYYTDIMVVFVSYTIMLVVIVVTLLLNLNQSTYFYDACTRFEKVSSINCRIWLCMNVHVWKIIEWIRNHFMSIMRW